MAWLGLVSVRISVDIYAIARERLYLYVGRGTLIQKNDGRTNDDRKKDVVS